MHNILLFIIISIMIVGTGCNDHAPPQVQNVSSRKTDNSLEYRKGAYLWKPSCITMTLHNGDHLVTKGKYIRLDQKLPKGESGWTMSIIDLPDNWDIINLRFDGLAIKFQNQHGEIFKIQPPKLNDLRFEILNGGEKKDTVLEVLWRKYALLKNKTEPLH